LRLLRSQPISVQDTTSKIAFNYEDDVFTYTPELVAVSKWAGTLASVYEPTVFDKTVGWSRWIRLNRQEPSLWSKSGFSDELDDDDQ
jgi:hypothetical protein